MHAIRLTSTAHLALLLALSCPPPAAVAGESAAGAPLRLAQAGEEQVAAPAAGAEAAPARPVTAADLAAVLDLAEPRQKQAILADEARLQELVDNEITARALLAAARDNGFDQAPQVKLMLQRAQDKMLLDAYLNQVVRENLDPAYPTEEQLRKYYEDNQAKLQTPERVHLWQVFLAVPAGADEAAVAAAEKKAKELSKKLRSGKSDFAQIATESSQHQASRYNGGYMGLIRLDELLPEVKAAVEELEENEVSGPIKTSDGFHVVKRGARVASQPMPYEEIKAKLREAMVSEAAARTRSEVVAKVRATYPVATDPADPKALTEALRKAAQAARQSP